MKSDLKKGETVAGIATLVTVLLSVGKGLVGFLSGSVALIADAIHSAVDVVAISASWFGLKISQKKANEKFPYGFYKAENIATLFISGFIFYVAYELFVESLEHITELNILHLPKIALLTSLVSSLISIGIAYYEQKVGKEINSQSLIANAQETKMDVISSLVVFIGLLFSYFNIPFVEGFVGLLIALLIFKVAIQNARLSIYGLMDASADKSLEKNVQKTIRKDKRIKGINHLKMRQSGPFVFGECALELNKNLGVKEAHDIAHDLENSVKSDNPEVEAFSVHIEPYSKRTIKVLIPINTRSGLSSEPNGHFARAKFFLQIILESNHIKSFKHIENPYLDKKMHAGLSAAKFITQKNIDILFIKHIGEISYHTLKDNLVDIYLIKGKTAKDVIDNFLKGRLKEIHAPTHEVEKK